MGLNDRVTAVIVNYQTADLLRTAAGSLRRHYPGLPLLLVDNGSKDGSRSVIEEFCAGTSGVVRPILNEINIHHGPAMDQALRAAATPYILFLDSDCEVLDAGFLEEMVRLLDERPEHYAAGQRIYMDRRGFDAARSDEGAVPYIRPVCMLIRRDLYLTLPPFQLHGAPCLDNMTEASRRGLGLLDVPIGNWVAHKGRGTASRHGYRLGLAGKLNHLLHKLGL
jgi:glycosyltransferase involved in cell wall biosynthesis